MDVSNMLNLAVLVLVGAMAGTLAARIARGSNFGFVVNAILGIAGAVVGGFIFSFLGLTPGKGIVNVINNNFGVTLPQTFVGQIVSATIGAILILMLARMLKLGKR